MRFLVTVIHRAIDANAVYFFLFFGFILKHKCARAFKCHNKMRFVARLLANANFTWFHWLFCATAGIDHALTQNSRARFSS